MRRRKEKRKIFLTFRILFYLQNNYTFNTGYISVYGSYMMEKKTSVWQIKSQRDVRMLGKILHVEHTSGRHRESLIGEEEILMQSMQHTDEGVCRKWSPSSSSLPSSDTNIREAELRDREGNVNRRWLDELLTSDRHLALMYSYLLSMSCVHLLWDFA